MKDSFREGREIAMEIANMLGYNKDFINAANPIISNAIYARDKEILEKERMQVLINLSRSIKDLDVLTKAIEDLGYVIKQK